MFCSPHPADPPGAVKAAALKVLLAHTSLPSSRADGDKDKHDGEQGGRPYTGLCRRPLTPGGLRQPWSGVFSVDTKGLPLCVK